MIGERLGIAADLKARRESFADRHPAMARRIRGQAPTFANAKSHCIEVNVAKGERIIRAGEPAPTATKGAIDRRVDAILTSRKFAEEIDRRVNARLNAEIDAIVAKRMNEEAAKMARLVVPDGPDVAVIIQAASAVTGKSYEDFKSPRRSKDMFWPRHLAMWLVRQLRRDLSLPAIGRIFGRDHTSVLHATRAFEERRHQSPYPEWLADPRIRALFEKAAQ